MEKKQKKKYLKPKLTQIKLDPKCAVLGFCKASSTPFGPGQAGCGIPGSPCSSGGS
jgi:hypothetical protein